MTAWPAGDLETVGECPICGARERIVLHEGLTDDTFRCAPGEWTLHACAGCGSAYLDPRPTPESIGAAYERYYTHQASRIRSTAELGLPRRLVRALANGYRNWRFGADERPASPLGIPLAHLLPATRSRLDRQYRHLPAAGGGARLLDVGCGDAAFLELAQRAGWRTAGVDPDPVAVANARQRGLDVREGGIEAYAGEREAFDVITMSHVLEHVHDPRATIRLARELLKPGGTLWIETPNIRSFGHTLFGAAWRGLEAPRHLVLLHWESTIRLLRELGFDHFERLPQHDVYASVYGASDAIKHGRDPYAERIMTLRLRLVASIASFCARLAPGRTEFLTVAARKPAGTDA